MRKLILLIIILLANLIAFSQTGTKSTIGDSVLVLPKVVAREIVKDLIRNDSLLTELSISKKNFNLLMENSVAKDSLINLKSSQIDLFKQKEANYEIMLQLKDQQKQNLEDLTKKLNKDLKAAERKLRFGVVGGTAVIILAAILIFR